jgi:hypothetical protein
MLVRQAFRYELAPTTAQRAALSSCRRRPLGMELGLVGAPQGLPAAE